MINIGVEQTLICPAQVSLLHMGVGETHSTHRMHNHLCGSKMKNQDWGYGSAVKASARQM